MTNGQLEQQGISPKLSPSKIYITKLEYTYTLTLGHIAIYPRTTANL